MYHESHCFALKHAFLESTEVGPAPPLSKSLCSGSFSVATQRDTFASRLCNGWSQAVLQYCRLLLGETTIGFLE